VSQKTTLEISLASLNARFKKNDKQLASLRLQYNKMMPYDANIQNMQREAEIANKEYTDALDGFNKSKNIQNVSGFHMQIDQKGMPGNPEPSKRLLYLAGAGIGSFALCLAFLLAVFALDNSITTLRQLERGTKAKAIGGLNTINGNERNIREIWNDKSGNQNYEIYRDLLRALRFEISNQMDSENKKILGVTSLVAGEGKTLIAYGLAYAFAMTGKKILLIADELPVVKSESKSLAKSQTFDTFLIKKEINTEDLITVLNKNMVQSSLLESQSFKSLQAGFDSLRADFDMVIIDVNSLHNMNIAKEWLLFTEMNVAVFAYGRTMGENDHELASYIKNKPGFIGWIMNKMELPKK
jgi:succinoglycan biosynthesis transport protein ExoP